MGASTGRRKIRTATSSDDRSSGPVRVFIGGTFDGIHSGHLYLLQYARDRGAELARRTGRPGVHLSAVVARDESVIRIKGRESHHNQNERRALLAAMRGVDNAIIGVPNDFILSVRRIDPDLIVLGYDQKPSWEGALRAAGIHAELIRSPAYESSRLKSSKMRSDLKAMAT